MAIQPVPAAPAALPFPGLNEKAAGTYNASAFAWGNQMPAYADGIKALGDNVHNNANAAYIAAQAAVPAATLAVEAANTALNAPGVMATSSTSLELTAGIKDLVLDQVGKTFGKGQTVVLAVTANPLLQASAIVLNNVPDTGVLQLSLAQPVGSGTHAGWTISVGAPTSPIPRFSYADRAQLRTFVAVAGACASVEGLGFFVYAPGSDEPDDDESCFATSSGCWLLEAVSYELVDAWMAPVLDSVAPNTQFLHGSGTCALTSVATNSVVSFTASIPGAEVGDRVLLSPPSPLGATVSFYGRVTATDTVTVYLANGPTASGSAMTGVWGATVFKEIQ